MALTDAAVILPGTGHVLLGPVGTTKPTLSAITAYVTSGTAISGLTTIGHTAVDSLPTPGQDGGDQSTLATWQASAFRTSVAATTDYIEFQALQIDGVVLPLYYGGGTVTAGNYAAPDTPSAVQRATLSVFVDGSTVVALWSYKADVIRADAPNIANDSFIGFPIRATFVKSAGQPRFEWIAASIS